jgi:hypothetical protein
LPLRVDHRVDPAGQVLAALRAQQPGDGGVVQLVIQAPARMETGRARSEARRLRQGRGTQTSGDLGSIVSGVVNEWRNSGQPHGGHGGRARRPADPAALERAKGIETKLLQPLLSAELRVGTWASSRSRARARLGGVVAAYGQFQELGGLRRAREPFCGLRLRRCLSPVRPRLLLNCAEAAALIALPEQSASAPLSFSEAPAQRVAPVAEAPRRGLLLGRSDQSGFDRDIRIEPRALLQHAHLLGPTGRGKSTLLLNMTLEAIGAGMVGWCSTRPAS